MKKMLSAFLIVAMLCLMIFVNGCANSRDVDIKDDSGKDVKYNFKPYGIFNPSNAHPQVQYRVSWGNIIWSAILMPTVVVPVIMIGWYLYEPCGQRVPVGKIVPGTVDTFKSPQ